MNIAEQALPLWGLEDAKTVLIAARENSVFRVDHPSGVFALRLHRQGYRTNEQLISELNWMAWLSQSGLSVPVPKTSSDGSHLQIIDDVQVDVLSWITGGTLDTVLPKLGTSERTQLFHSLGRDMAKLHIASDAWPEAISCARPSWDVDGLLGAMPLWDRFWDNAGLKVKERDLLCAFRKKARQDLNRFSSSLDCGLIHADLVPANVIVDGDMLHFIDFDDGGFGFRQFEVATALLKHRSACDFDKLQSALIDGYNAKRDIDTTSLTLFMALRAVTYVGWNITRMAEDDTGERNARFIAQAIELADDYLET